MSGGLIIPDKETAKARRELFGNSEQLDTISRQAAIDALNEQIEQCDKALSSFDISMKDEYAVKVERASLMAYKETIEYLPSAQPAEADVQKMQEMEQAEIQKAYELGKLDAMEEMPHWTPCSERKPPDEIDPHTLDYKLYACSCVFRTVEAVRAYKYGENHFWNGPGIVDEYVVAWMPFPEPYRAAGGETDGEA